MGVLDEENRTLENKQLSRQAAIDRRKRINRYKKILVWTCIIAILIPIIMCIIMLIRIHKLEKDIDNLLAMKESGQIVAQTDSAGARYLVLAADAGHSDDNKEEMQSTGEKVTEDTQPVTTQPATTQPAEETTTAGDYTGKRAFLTFDDGPSENTVPILDVLNSYNIPATFFVIGKMDEQSKKLYKVIVDRGSAIGLHSFSHQYSSLYASIESFSADLTKIHDYVKDVTGKDIKLFRFPGGSGTTTNTVDIKQIIKYLNDNGYKYVDWNVSSEDATGRNISADEMARMVITQSLSCNSAYILMHDAKGKESTVESLPMIIEELQKNGYKFCSIDTSTEPLVQQVKASEAE